MESEASQEEYEDIASTVTQNRNHKNHSRPRMLTEAKAHNTKVHNSPAQSEDPESESDYDPLLEIVTGSLSRRVPKQEEHKSKEVPKRPSSEMVDQDFSINTEKRQNRVNRAQNDHFSPKTKIGSGKSNYKEKSNNALSTFEVDSIILSSDSEDDSPISNKVNFLFS